MTTIAEITVLGNPGHGNGPTVTLLMAAEAIQRLSNRRVNLVFPDLADGRQRTVIGNRRDRDRDVHVFLDAQLGELLRRVTLRDNNFRQNVCDIAAYQDHVQAYAQAYIEHGLYELTELLPDGRESESRRTFLLPELTLEFNHGSRVRFLSSERAFYFFPCLLSHLLKSPDAQSGLDETTLGQALARMTVLEASYARAFLPGVHTFSWDPHWERPPNVVFTPFPRPAVSVDTAPLPAGYGVYLMPSGVGDAGDNKVAEIAEIILAQADMPLSVYYPPADQPPQACIRTFPNAVELNARYILHPDVQLVVGRAGWGTLWECLNAGKVFVAIPPIPGDDLEIKFNLETLKTTNLGVTWPNHSQRQVWEEVPRVRAAVREKLNELNHKFGTTDGLDVMAREILRSTLQDIVHSEPVPHPKHHGRRHPAGSGATLP